MNLMNSFKKIFRNDKVVAKEFNSSIIQEHLDGAIHDDKRKFIVSKDIKEAYEDMPYRGKWKAKDLRFAQLWNNDSYEPEKRNYSRRMMIFNTSDYKSYGDENGGCGNGRDEEISLTYIA